jgi:hypothetical protein
MGPPWFLMSANKRTEGTVGAPVCCAGKIIDFYALPALGVAIALTGQLPPRRPDQEKFTGRRHSDAER